MYVLTSLQAAKRFDVPPTNEPSAKTISISLRIVVSQKGNRPIASLARGLEGEVLFEGVPFLLCSLARFAFHFPIDRYYFFA